jgi:hypothetical protein
MENAPTLHEKAASYRLGEELCLDLARKHVGYVEWNKCETCKRLTQELRAVDKNKKAVKRCKACERKMPPRFHYEQIASILYCGRQKPLSEVERESEAEKCSAYLDSMTHEETLLRRDLAAVKNDPAYSIKRRNQASNDLDCLRRVIECREKDRFREWVAASSSAGSFPPHAQRLLREFERLGAKKFFGRLDRVIQRYLTAKARNATWAASLRLLEYVALEWLRDKRALQGFIKDAFARWEEFENPKSTRHKSAVMHQAYSDCNRFGVAIKPMTQIVDRLLKQGAAEQEKEGAAAKLDGALRAQKSKEEKRFSKLEAKSLQFVLQNRR